MDVPCGDERIPPRVFGLIYFLWIDLKELCIEMLLDSFVACKAIGKLLSGLVVIVETTGRLFSMCLH